MTVVGLLCLVTSAVLWIAVLVRATEVHRPRNRFDVVLLLFAAGATGDLAAATGVLDVSPAAMHILLVTSTLAGLLVAWELLQLVDRNGTPARGRHAWRWATLATVLGMSALCLAGGPTGAVPDNHWRSDAAMVTFWCWYGVALIAAAGAMLVLLIRLVRCLPGGPLRQAATLAAAAVALGGTYGLSVLFVAAGGSGWPAGVGRAGVAYSTLSYLIVGIVAFRLRVARLTRPASDRRLLRRLEPLWQRLLPIDPAVALRKFPEDTEPLRARQLSVACVRAAIEIRDWMALLAQRLPPEAYEDARAAAARVSSEPDAAAAAGWIRAGLACPAPRVGRPHSAPPPEGADIDEDLALLSRIAAVPEPTATLVAAAIGGPGPAEHSRTPRSREDRNRRPDLRTTITHVMK